MVDASRPDALREPADTADTAVHHGERHRLAQHEALKVL
jgi:hypothetical protein